MKKIEILLFAVVCSLVIATTFIQNVAFAGAETGSWSEQMAKAHAGLQTPPEAGNFCGGKLIDSPEWWDCFLSAHADLAKECPALKACSQYEAESADWEKCIEAFDAI